MHSGIRPGIYTGSLPGDDIVPLYSSQEESVMEKDVVCGMQVEPATAAGVSERNGKKYYFCSKSCKAKFDANPGNYTK
jgi:YHS domain-containing protein